MTKLPQLTNTKARNHQDLPKTSSVTSCSKWVGSSLGKLYKHHMLPLLNVSYFHTQQRRWITSKSFKWSINYLYLIIHSVSSSTALQLHWQAYARVPFFFTSFVFNLWNSGILFLLVKQEGFSIIALFSA